MSDGFMIWFFRGKSTASIIDHLAATGANLAYPIAEDSESVIDLEGTPDLISSEAFIALLEDNAAPTLTFQTWYSTSEDMIVTSRRNRTEGSSKATFYAVTCYLDGLETEQLESAIAGADQIESRAPDDLIGIVIDKHGTTEDFDWDAVVRTPAPGLRWKFSPNLVGARCG